MRIFDRVAAGETVLDSSEAFRPLKADGRVPLFNPFALRKHANTAVRVVADDAAEFYWHSPQLVWHEQDNDFGPVRPPFPEMWIEWTTPEWVYVSHKWVQREPEQVAMLTHATPMDDGQVRVSTFCLGTSAGRIVTLPSHRQLVLTADGLYVSGENLVDVQAVDRIAERAKSTRFQMASDLNVHSDPGLLALGWMNCKNVNLSDIAVPERLARKRQRKGQPRGLSYKRIVIAGKRSGSSAGNGADGTKVRKHLVRGHFKTYTDDHKLFGKYTGTYWWSWQVRGDESLGTINHEYHVTDRAAQ